MTLSLFLQPLLVFALVSSAQTPAAHTNSTPTQPAACPCASCVTVSLGCTQVKPSSPPRPPGPKACRDGDKARCELETGRAYLEYDFWTEAIQHCGIALRADKWRDAAKECIGDAKAGLTKEKDALAKERDHARSLRSEAIHARLTVIGELIDRSAFAAAEAEIAELRKHLHDDDTKLGSVEKPEEQCIDHKAKELARRRYSCWEICRYRWSQVPQPIAYAFKILWWVAVGIVFIWLAEIVRKVRKWFKWHWLGKAVDEGPTYKNISWNVARIVDDTKQLAAGAVMDALNVDHNPLFQTLGSSSLLALPPSLFEKVGAADNKTTTGMNADSRSANDNLKKEVDAERLDLTVLRNFMLPTSISDNGGLDVDPWIRASLSNWFEDFDRSRFARHRFKQADAFDELTVKLGVVEGSLGGILNTVNRWWTNGWPTVTGSVMIEKVGDGSYASVRLMCNFDVSNSPGYSTSSNETQTNEPDYVETSKLFRQEKTLAAFASTKVERYTDAVDLAAQRAAFRLLYRLAKRADEPNLAIAVSSYRQGIRLLMTAL